MHRASMAHNECGWKRSEGAARTAVIDESCRHGGIDKKAFSWKLRASLIR
jgi:hypothetical protein